MSLDTSSFCTKSSYEHGQESGRRILIYFAGHGHSMEPSFGGPNMGYIVPKDAPNPHQDEVGFRATAINMDRIESYAVEIHAKHALFLFDSCFSGSIFTLTRAFPEAIQAKTAQPVRQFITAGKEDEKVPDESIFRAQFVLALEGEADKDGDGYVTGSELGHFLQKRVQNYSRQAQNPQYGTLRNPNLSRGDFVFPLPRDEEKEGWEAIRDSTDPSDFRSFIEGFPEGRFAAEAQGRLDELEQARWETIRDTGDPAVLRAFVKAFPDGRFAIEAQRRLARLEEARWAAVKGSTDPSDFRAFLRDFPDGHHTGEARRLLDQLQQVAVCSGYVQADQFIRATYCYRRILSADADHELAQRGLYEIAEHYYARAAEVMEEARGRARSYDDAMLQVAEAVRQLEGVDAEHPGIGELRSRLKGLRRDDEAQLTALRAEVEQLQGEIDSLRREAAEWVRIQDSDWPANYAAYLEGYRGGMFETLVRNRLRELEQRDAEAQRLAAERRRRELEHGQRFRDCPECPEMVVVRSGSFMMGSPPGEEGRDKDEDQRHRVAIAEPFAVGIFEVTFREWDACVSGGGCKGYRPDDDGWGRGDRPVINVSWEDAQAYVRWLSGKTKHPYRLLSESEWEYVARAGTTGSFHTGSTISPEQANYNGNYMYAGGRIGVYRRRTVPVGSFGPNGFGLHEVHGNVWEWVQDCWNGSYWDAPSNGRAWETGNCGLRVARGGSWYYAPRILRAANRVRNTTGNRNNFLGFRIARTLTP